MPVSKNEDKARREFILNVLLLSIISLSLVAFLMNLIKWIMGLYNAMSAGVVFIVFSFFVVLYTLSRKGFSTLTSTVFLGVFFLLNSYTAIKYGVDISDGLLVYALIIVMSGILVNTRFAFFTAGFTAFFIVIVAYLQINSILPPDSYWRLELLNMANAIFIAVVLLIIAVVSWLSNREIEKSLKRARKSEAELKQERDSLEITVEERTKELKEAQVEKISQLYRFAEFGRLSAGIFHDLMNPLNSVSLNTEKLKNTTNNKYVERATGAARKLQDLVIAVRKQLARQANKKVFSVNKEIKDIISILSYKASKAKIKVHFSAQDEISIFGDAVRLNQVVLNLIANAIDSYSHSGSNARREIAVYLYKEDGKLVLKVVDYGAGIPAENLTKIFEPFFTTKTNEEGIGIGLSMTKSIIEKDFGGSISVSSKVNAGATFIVEFPVSNE